MFYHYAIVNDFPAAGAAAAPFVPTWSCAMTVDASVFQASPEIPAVPLLLMPAPPPPPITPVFMNTAKISFV